MSDKLDLELNVVPYQTVRQSGSPMASGFGDLTARAKYVVIGGRHRRHPDARAQACRPPPSRSATGAVEGGLVVPVGFTLPAGMALALNPEIDAFHDGVGNGTHAAYALSGVLSRNVTPEFIAAVELWGAHNDDPAGHTDQASFDVGFAFIPAKDQNLQFDAGANFGLTRATPDVNLYVGISRRF